MKAERKDRVAWGLLVLVVAVLIGLGVWQLQRLGDKEALIAAYDAAQALPPVPYAEVASAAPEKRFRRVRVEGRWLHEKELHLGGRSYARETGYEILTPLLMADGRIVLVNRGWVPSSLKERAARPNTIAAATGSLTGQIKEPIAPGLFTPSNHPEKNFWFTVDIPAMEKATGLTLEPVSVEAIGPFVPGHIPVPADGQLHIRNDHLGYAITWFLLAIGAAVVFSLFLRGRARERATA